MTLAQFDRLFPDEDSCKRYLMERRWPDGPRCPRCGNEKLYRAKRAWSWECHKCGPHPYRFSLYVGTVFENTNYPLCTWFKVLYFLLTSKKGISALQIHRTIGSGSYRTPWYMGYEHHTVKHSAGEYVRGDVHTQNLDSFWSLLKRGVIGTYHHISENYLPLDHAAFQFRLNNRQNPDIFASAVRGC
jgi:predicted RNA-binding Zn-ribbon protein involved in translation (DUF1610 family)